MKKILLLLLLSILMPFLALAEPSSSLSLKVASAEFLDRNGFYASLVRQRGFGDGLEITLVARNESQTEIFELDLYGANCFYSDRDGLMVRTCALLQYIELEDGLGNNLNGGVFPMKNTVLYPGEQVRIRVYGHRPVDGNFKLRFGQLVLEGKVTG